MKSETKNESMLDIARHCVEQARKRGASDAAATANIDREVEVRWRDGKLDKISEATKRGVTVRLYVDGRYSSASTSERQCTQVHSVRSSSARARLSRKMPSGS